MRDSLSLAFGKHIAKIRQEKGLTQEKLAEICSFDRTYIGAIERGEKCPTLKTIKKIADGLELSLMEIMDFET